MAEAKTVTILNQRAGKVILRDGTVLMAGRTAEVSEAEAKVLLNHKGIVDAKTNLGLNDSAEVKSLKAQLAASEKDRARLTAAAKKRGAPEPAPEKTDAEDKDNEAAEVITANLDAKKGASCLLPDGTTGVIQSLNKAKKTAKVKRDDNGNVSEFAIDDLKAVPEGAAV